MGASYGSLLGSKLALSGHSANMVCLPEEADLINAEGARVRLPIRNLGEIVEINCPQQIQNIKKSLTAQTM